MKWIIDRLLAQPAIFYLLIFLGMIIPSLFLFPIAENNNQPGVILLLGLVVLANLITVFPPRSK